MDTIMGQIYGAIGVVLAGVVTFGITWALKKYLGIELDKNQQKQAKEIVLSGAEKAASWLKKGGKKIPGDELHGDAVVELKALNPDMTTKEAVGQIDRAVGSLPTVGAFKPLQIMEISGA